MQPMRIERVVKSALITAFSIAAALLWRDFIVSAIAQFVPQNALQYEFLAALIATVLIVVVIIIIFKTEEEAQSFYKLYKKNGKKKKKK